ncbi:hypothetical protein Hanom_Chr02g00174111 [Helianthus anomalus]
MDENRTLAQISGTNLETYYYKTPLILLLFLFNYKTELWLKSWGPTMKLTIIKPH